MNMTTEATPNKIFFIGDILSLIFTYTDKHCNTVCARVCKQWVDPALNEVWRDLGQLDHTGTLENLIQVLAPLEIARTEVGYYNETTKKIFSSRIPAKQWNRFDFYAKRVRTLRIGTKDSLAQSIFTELGFRITHRILPNLVELTLDLWECAFSHLDRDVGLHLPRSCLLFLHDGIEKLDIVLPTLQGQPVHSDYEHFILKTREMFEEVILRAPTLSAVSIYFSCEVSSIADDISMLAHGLENLRELYLPPNTLTTGLFAELIRIPSVDTISFVKWTDRSRSIEDIVGFAKNDNFNSDVPNLRSLDLAGSYRYMKSFFDRDIDAAYPNLTSLTLKMVQSYSPNQLSPLLSDISSSCPTLTALNLCRYPSVEEPTLVDMGALEALTCFSSLRDFTLDCYYPVSLADDELVSILSNCPSLRSIRLSYQPSGFLLSSTSLNLLGKLALAGSEIEELYLYVNSESTAPTILPPGCRLRRLRSLCFGDSPISDQESVAAYLYQFLPFDLVTYPAEMKNDDTDAERNGRRKAWQGVQTLLRFSRRVREADITRINELKNEVERLRLNVEVVNQADSHETGSFELPSPVNLVG